MYRVHTRILGRSLIDLATLVEALKKLLWDCRTTKDELPFSIYLRIEVVAATAAPLRGMVSGRELLQDFEKVTTKLRVVEKFIEFIYDNGLWIYVEWAVLLL